MLDYKPGSRLAPWLPALFLPSFVTAYKGRGGVILVLFSVEQETPSAGCLSMANVDNLEREPAPSVPRYLGLDIGTKRIGVAVSDELASLARPVLTLWRKKPREDVRSLARLARRHGCSGVVVGNPLHMSGEASPLAAKIQRFAEELGQFSGLPIVMWDERLPTREAHQLLYEAGKPRQEHGAVVDQVAAVLILQGFLDAKLDTNRSVDPDATRPAPEDPNPHAPCRTSSAE